MGCGSSSLPSDSEFDAIPPSDADADQQQQGSRGRSGTLASPTRGGEGERGPGIMHVGNSTKQMGSSKNKRKGPLSQKSINQRMELPSGVERFVISDGITADFAWVSQRGYYPDSPNKDNQDSYSVYPSFYNDKKASNEPKNAFFGIYDGHGKTGHNCAWYARDHLPVNISKRLASLSSPSINSKLEGSGSGSDKVGGGNSVKSSSQMRTSATIKQALSIAHLETNEALHQSTQVDDHLSGTTAISVLFEGRTIYVSNVGDSRAIIASRKPTGELVASALSSDQTPYRKDERERVKKYGARILSIDQIEGVEPIHENWGNLVLGEEIDEGGDPPRIWSPRGDYPGTAFSRSIGDAVAEEVGVTAEPEILERYIYDNDELIIIASDGVFEFLTNQMVTDMIALENDNKNLLDICKMIVGKAYDMWLQYETRTDDITIIALALNHTKPSTGNNNNDDSNSSSNSSSNSNSKNSSNSNNNNNNNSFHPSNPASDMAVLGLENTRPIRRQIARNQNILLDYDNTNETDTIDLSNLKSLYFPKEASEKQLILNVMKNNFLFEHLSTDQRQVIVELMKPKIVKKGEWVIRQGDVGTSMYIVQTGRFEARAIPTHEEVDEYSRTTGGELIRLYDNANRTAANCFGELSLMYGKPRLASVIAIDNGKLWSLERQFYRALVMRSYDCRKNIIKTLLNVKLLQCLNLRQIQRLADVFSEETFSVDEHIINQGDAGGKFYVIASGTCDVISTSASGEEKVTATLNSNEYFGEVALLDSSPRTASVISRTLTRVLSLEKANFDKLLGPLTHIIEEERIKRNLAVEGGGASSKSSAIINSFSQISGVGVVSEDDLMVLSLGRFGIGVTSPNIGVVSFICSEVQKSRQIASFLNMVKTIQVISANIVSPFIINYWKVMRDSNAVHIALKTPIVCGLYDVISYYSNKNPIGEEGSTSPQSGSGKLSSTTLRSNKMPAESIVYIIASVASALNALHNLGIIYRSVHPGGITIDCNGVVVLSEFRTSKIGISANVKTFTLCGAADYLSPEQVCQKGHGAATDLWALGVLVYECCFGASPFADAAELTVYSLISSYGSKQYPRLTFQGDNATTSAYSDFKTFISQLVVANPSLRPSLTSEAEFDVFKSNPLFKSLDWGRLGSSAADSPSPLMQVALSEMARVEVNPIHISVTAKFSEAFRSEDDWESSLASS